MIIFHPPGPHQEVLVPFTQGQEARGEGFSGPDRPSGQDVLRLLPHERHLHRGHLHPSETHGGGQYSRVVVGAVWWW